MGYMHSVLVNHIADIFTPNDNRIIRTPRTGFEPTVRKTTCDPDVIWTRNLLNWSQTRYRCATKPVVYWKNCYSRILEILTRLRRFWMTCVRALKRAWNFEGNRSWGEYLHVLTCFWTKRPSTPSVVRTPHLRNRGWTRYPLRHDRSQRSWTSNGVLNVYVRFFDMY